MSSITNNTNHPAQRIEQGSKETGTLTGRIVSQLKTACKSKAARIATRIAVVALAAIAISAVVLGVLILTHGTAAAPLIKFIASVIGSTATNGLTAGVIGAYSLIGGGAGVLAATLAYRVGRLIKLNRLHIGLTGKKAPFVDQFKVFLGLGLSKSSEERFKNFMDQNQPRTNRRRIR